ncbi:hypothetical protein ENU1_140490 [Entamoeba nuttalli P19]|uniref:Uncharacterized protein n=2 Tax=Entamoeba nuttalli TaxID=412467 RepID=K2GVP4_ENTNP|nr:hypothetical protein ENU1_140490 [Entamoeba nuttalli P19]EKE39143.1 hypothetical protein ENU1_140490 [Entamoeba nuttalli P19]|eukprot:XP_008858524.1 hypothetical protein ENU1_140490 [Entamoeba nuttalli P19]
MQSTTSPQKRPKQQESRVRLEPELYRKLKQLQQKLGFKTLTQLIDYLINEYTKLQQPETRESIPQNIPSDTFWSRVVHVLMFNGVIDANTLLQGTQNDPFTHNQLRQILIHSQSPQEIQQELQQEHQVGLEPRCVECIKQYGDCLNNISSTSTNSSSSTCLCMCPHYQSSSQPCAQGLCYTLSTYFDDSGEFHSNCSCPYQNQL